MLFFFFKKTSKPLFTVNFWSVVSKKRVLRVGQRLYKITNNYMINKGSTPFLTNLVGVHPRNIYTKFEANQYRFKISKKYDIT